MDDIDNLLVDLDERAENDPYHGYLHRLAAAAIRCLQAARAAAEQVRADAISSMRECESRMRSAEDERDALRSALVSLEQAYSNKHSPQHRAAALNQAAGVLMIVDGCQAVRESQS